MSATSGVTVIPANHVFQNIFTQNSEPRRTICTKLGGTSFCYVQQSLQNLEFGQETKKSLQQIDISVKSRWNIFFVTMYMYCVVWSVDPFCMDLTDHQTVCTDLTDRWILVGISYFKFNLIDQFQSFIKFKLISFTISRLSPLLF